MLLTEREVEKKNLRPSFLCTIRDIDRKLKLDNDKDNKMVKRDIPKREGLRT